MPYVYERNWAIYYGFPYAFVFYCGWLFLQTEFFYCSFKKDFRRLVIPYLFICIATMFIASVQESRTNHAVSIVTDVLYGCGTPAWFLLGLFGARAIFNRVLCLCPNRYIIVSLVISSIPLAISLNDELPTTLSFLV